MRKKKGKKLIEISPTIESPSRKSSKSPFQKPKKKKEKEEGGKRYSQMKV